MTAGIVDGRVLLLALALVVAVIAWKRIRGARRPASEPTPQPQIPEADCCMVSSPRCAEPWEHELHGWLLCTGHYQAARRDTVFDQEASS
ncbi:hypothetical protein GCM10009740_31670 [Terrabacter terrae]|uniref:Uncharacterized protein n=1 Tax=Terrabacter terrae TaxID=318434 RepID=A0ABN2UK47_9MICO